MRIEAERYCALFNYHNEIFVGIKMSVNTSNAYGRITITEEAIAQIAGCSALECYGVVELVSRGLTATVTGV